MNLTKTKKVYTKVISEIKDFLQKANEFPGFNILTESEKLTLSRLSVKAKQFQDEIPSMSIKAPKSLAEMLSYEMYKNG